MKKKFYIISAFLLLTSSVFSQKITIDDMINKTKCKTLTCFSDFITTKGFSYLTVKQTDDYKNYCFASDEIVNSSSTEGIITKNHAWFYISTDTKNVSVSVVTSDRNYYSVLISQMRANAFMESSSETDVAGQIRVIYTSNSYPTMTIKIITQRLTKDSNSWTSYDIDVRAYR